MHSRKGFTLIELLVVISIIALLSSVITASLNASRDKARYTAVAQSLKQADIAFNLLRNDRSCWPREGSTDCGGYASSNPNVSTLIGSGTFGLSQYLPAPPTWPLTAGVWQYDNDGDSIPQPCSAYSTAGVKLFVTNVPIEHYRVLNTIIDGDANPDSAMARACGKVVTSVASGSGDFIYIISETQ